MRKITVVFMVAAGVLMTACASRFTTGYDAYVGASDQTGAREEPFSSIQGALDAAPEDAAKPYRIYIAAGNYYEKLTITKPNIQLIGAGRDRTRIYFDAYAGQLDDNGVAWGTRRSGTIIVRAEDVQFQHLTIENSFDFLTNDARDKSDPAKVHDTQAVALYLDAGSDRVLVKDVKLLGYQDTLFVNAGRSWFDESIIAGNVDYIFGAGNALFTDSEIRTRIRGKVNQPHGYITAPSTDIASAFGLTFVNCTLTRETGIPDNSTFLGRPWHPTTDFPDGRYADPNAVGKSVFLNTKMAAHISEHGWHSMGGTTREGGKRPFLPENARFFEYHSAGAGAAVNNHRRQLTEEEAAFYTRENILGDWRL